MLAPGEIIGIQRGTDKARFRVVWAGTPSTPTNGQVGLICVQDNRNIWALDFESNQQRDTFDLSQLGKTNVAVTPHSTTPQVDRRRDARFECNLLTEYSAVDSEAATRARCTDISRGGCYVETAQPLPVSTRLRVQLSNGTIHFHSDAEVRSTHPSLGMGIRFTEMSPEDRESLNGLLSTLHSGSDRGALRSSRLTQLLHLLQIFQREVPGMRLDPTLADSVESVLRNAKAALEALQEGLNSKRSSLEIKAAIDSVCASPHRLPVSSDAHENPRAN